jgi:hypothetical protein
VVIAPSETAASVRTAPVRIYSFDEFTLDVAARKLLRGGIATPLPSRAFDALVYLIERRERLVQKNELIDAIWAGVVVTDDTAHAISALRRALADERAHPKYIEIAAARLPFHRRANRRSRVSASRRRAAGRGAATRGRGLVAGHSLRE